MKIKDFFRTKYDVCIPNELLRLIYAVSEKLTKSETLVLLDILQHGGANHEVSISLSQFAVDCGITERSAATAIKKLKKRGAICYEHQHGEHAPAYITLCISKIPFTQIPAAAFSAAMGAGLSFHALRLLAFIWRNTYGYKGKHGEAATPTSTFSDSYIKRGTGIDRKNAYRALRELQAMGAITIGLTVGYYRGTGHDIKEITVNDVWKQAAPSAVRISCGGEHKVFTGVNTQAAPPAVKFSGDTAVKFSGDTAVKFSGDENELENTAETARNETFVHMKNLPHKKNIKILYKECVNKDGLNARLRSQPQKILAVFPDEEAKANEETNVLCTHKEATESHTPETEISAIIKKADEKPEQSTVTTAEAEAEKEKADEMARAKKYQDSLKDLLNSLTDDEQSNFNELTARITLTPAEQLEEINRKASRIKAANCQKSMKQRII